MVARTRLNVTPDVYEVLNHISVFVIFCRAVSTAQYTCHRSQVLYQTRKLVLVQPGTCTHSPGGYRMMILLRNSAYYCGYVCC